MATGTAQTLIVQETLTVNGAAVFADSVTVNSAAGFNANVTVNTGITLSSNAFVMGSANAAANGYTRLPNGLLLQWGTMSVNSSTAAVAWPTPFTTLFAVTVSSNNRNHDVGHVAAIASNTTTATIRSTNTATVAASYLAIGT